MAEEKAKRVNINIGPGNGFVHVRIAEEAEGEEEESRTFEFDISPFDALGISSSLLDSSIVARVTAMMQQQQKQGE